MPDTRIGEPDNTECRELLAGRHLGRLALVDDRGPVVLPVNVVRGTLGEVTGRRIGISDELPFTWWG